MTFIIITFQTLEVHIKEIMVQIYKAERILLQTIKGVKKGRVEISENRIFKVDVQVQQKLVLKLLTV